MNNPNSCIIVTLPFTPGYLPVHWGYGDLFNALKITQLIDSLKKYNVFLVLPGEIYDFFETVCHEEDKKFILKLNDCGSIIPTTIIFAPNPGGRKINDFDHLSELLRRLNCKKNIFFKKPRNLFFKNI